MSVELGGEYFDIPDGNQFLSGTVQTRKSLVRDHTPPHEDEDKVPNNERRRLASDLGDIVEHKTLAILTGELNVMREPNLVGIHQQISSDLGIRLTKRAKNLEDVIRAYKPWIILEENGTPQSEANEHLIGTDLVASTSVQPPFVELAKVQLSLFDGDTTKDGLRQIDVMNHRRYYLESALKIMQVGVHRDSILKRFGLEPDQGNHVIPNAIMYVNGANVAQFDGGIIAEPNSATAKMLRDGDYDGVLDTDFFFELEIKSRMRGRDISHGGPSDIFDCDFDSSLRKNAAWVVARERNGQHSRFPTGFAYLYETPSGPPVIHTRRLDYKLFSKWRHDLTELCKQVKNIWPTDPSRQDDWENLNILIDIIGWELRNREWEPVPDAPIADCQKVLFQANGH